MKSVSTPLRGGARKPGTARANAETCVRLAQRRCCGVVVT